MRLLEESWISDVYPLQVSIAEYGRLAEPLQRYRGSVLLQQWYVHYLLIGCRRLVDYSEEAISIKRALIELRGIADDLTAERLADYRRHRDIAGDATDVNGIRKDMARQLDVPLGAPIGKRNVQPDISLINRIADRLKARVSHGIAHRLDAPKPPGVTRAEVERFLADLHNIYVRWSIVLRATDVYARPAEENLLAPIARALELFDWEAYIEAQGEAMKQHGPFGEMGWDELDQRARIEYRFD